jgi:hypothetical protein
MKTLTKPASIGAALFLTVAGSVTTATDASAATVSSVQIENVAFSQCVETPSLAANLRLRIARCSLSSAQLWSLTPTGAPSTYVIRNQFSDRCIGAGSATATPGAAVVQLTCDGSAAQHWVVEGLRYRHEGTDQCLDTVGGRGSDLMQFTCGQESPAGVQSWFIP